MNARDEDLDAGARLVRVELRDGDGNLLYSNPPCYCGSHVHTERDGDLIYLTLDARGDDEEVTVLDITIDEARELIAGLATLLR
jgi:hypothetical protein